MKNNNFSCLKHSDTVFILLINVKMPTIVGILKFMSMINFMLSWLWKKFYNLWAWIQTATFVIANFFECKIVNIFLSITLNMCFRCPEEPSYWDGSFEYLQNTCMFWFGNKKIILHSYLKASLFCSRCVDALYPSQQLFSHVETIPVFLDWTSTK